MQPAAAAAPAEPNIAVIIISLALLAVAIFLDTKFKLPLGITSLGFALVVGYLGLGVNPNKLLTSYFPTTIVCSLLFGMAFFLVFSSNGTTDIIAKAMLKLIKGRTKLFPWIMYFVNYLLNMLTGGAGIQYAIIPLTFAIAKKVGVSTQMAIALISLSTLGGTMNPFIGTSAANRSGFMLQNGITNAPGVAIAVWVGISVATLIAMVVMYILTKSWKVKNVEFSADADEKIEINPVHKKSLWLLGIVIFLFVVPAVLNMSLKTPFTAKLSNIFNNYTIFSFGILAALVLKLEKWNVMARKVNVNMIVMIIGITYLIQVAQVAGISQVIQNIAGAVPAWSVAPILIICFGVLSFFVTGQALSPIMYPLAVALAQTPAQGIAYLTCVLIGTAATGCSPISGQGAGWLAILPPEDQEDLSKAFFKQAFANGIIFMILAGLGLFALFGGIFAGSYY